MYICKPYSRMYIHIYKYEYIYYNYDIIYHIGKYIYMKIHSNELSGNYCFIDFWNI